MAKKLIKKAQDGDNLRKGQYKRIGRIAEKNPERAERVADRMNTRASRVDRGKKIANPGLNLMNEMRLREADRDYQMDMMKNSMKKNAQAMKKGGVVKKKMQSGGTLKTPTADQKGLKKLPTPVRNKMGFKKNGGTMSKKK